MTNLNLPNQNLPSLHHQREPSVNLQATKVQRPQAFWRSKSLLLRQPFLLPSLRRGMRIKVA